jgi:hypothetical protein
VIDTDTSDDGAVDIIVDGRTVSIRAGERSRKEILAAASVDREVVLAQRIGDRVAPVRGRVMIVGSETFFTQSA